MRYSGHDKEAMIKFLKRGYDMVVMEIDSEPLKYKISSNNNQLYGFMLLARPTNLLFRLRNSDLLPSLSKML